MQNINQTLEKYMKLNIGDPVLVTGPAHFEKAEVKKVSKESVKDEPKKLTLQEKLDERKKLNGKK